MQLDLLYKGLPSANADTRKFRVQIHSNAISFIQHEGCGSEGGGGRERVTLYTSSLPSTLRPPWTFVQLPSITFPPRAKEDGKKNRGEKRKRLWQGWCAPRDGDAPSLGTPRGPPAPGPPFPKPSATKPGIQGDAPGRARRVNKAKKPFGLTQVQLLLSLHLRCPPQQPPSATSTPSL